MTVWISIDLKKTGDTRFYMHIQRLRRVQIGKIKIVFEVKIS